MKVVNYFYNYFAANSDFRFSKWNKTLLWDGHCKPQALIIMWVSTKLIDNDNVLCRVSYRVLQYSTKLAELPGVPFCNLFIGRPTYVPIIGFKFAFLALHRCRNATVDLACYRFV